MAAESSVAAIRAAVEAVLPSTVSGPGAAELGVERHVVEQIEVTFPGMLDLLEIMLNAYASDVVAGSAFEDLSIEDRQQVLRLMSMEESQDIVEIVDAILVFTYGGVYSEWTGYDRATGRLDPPAVWDEVGYPGPSRGHPVYRTDA
jgi:gluconate 2-dehydrogenase subunit 3-like protein